MAPQRMMLIDPSMDLHNVADTIGYAMAREIDRVHQPSIPGIQEVRVCYRVRHVMGDIEVSHYPDSNPDLTYCRIRLSETGYRVRVVERPEDGFTKTQTREILAGVIPQAPRAEDGIQLHAV